VTLLSTLSKALYVPVNDIFGRPTWSEALQLVPSTLEAEELLLLLTNFLANFITDRTALTNLTVCMSMMDRSVVHGAEHLDSPDYRFLNAEKNLQSINQSNLFFSSRK